MWHCPICKKNIEISKEKITHHTCRPEQKFLIKLDETVNIEIEMDIKIR